MTDNDVDALISFLEHCGDADIEAGIGALLGGSKEVAFRRGLADALERLQQERKVALSRADEWKATAQDGARVIKKLLACIEELKAELETQRASQISAVNQMLAAEQLAQARQEHLEEGGRIIEELNARIEKYEKIAGIKLRPITAEPQ